MKKLISQFTRSILPAIILTACSEFPHKVTTQGIDPVLLGTPIAELPPCIEHLYDTIAINHSVFTESESGGNSLMHVERETYAYFSRGGQLVMQALVDPDNHQQIRNLTIFDSRFSYKGYGAGIPVLKLVEAGIPFYIYGNYESPSFGAFFLLNGVAFQFNIINGAGFSDAGKKRLYRMSSWDLRREYFTTEDFQPDACIDHLFLWEAQ